MDEMEVKRRNIISPWRNVAEFCDISEWIFGEKCNIGSWKLALEEMRVWINRRRSQCPAAVYATHAMLEVKYVDESKKLTSDELRSLYAFALIRFFNFMSSTIQTHNMRSMYTTAIELGLESFVVDIRHICAHGTELPELSVLRHTADYCLNWLNKYYWSMQSIKMIDANAKCLKKRDKTLQNCAKEIGKLCTLYDGALKCFLNRCEAIKEIKQILRGRQLVEFKEFCKMKNIKTIRESFNIIIMDMVVLIKTGVSRKHLSTIFAREFMKMKYFFEIAETHNSGIALEELIDVVQNLFRFLAVYNIIETILQRLFETAESNMDLSEKMRLGASFWARHIVEGFAIFIRCRKMFNISFDEDHNRKFDYAALNFGEMSKNVRKTYIYSGVNMKRSIIFGDSFQRPWVWHFNRFYIEKRVKAVNSYTSSILPSLWPLVKPKLNDNEIERLQNLIAIYLDKNTQTNGYERGDENKDNTIEDKIYTLQDICSNNKKILEKPNKLDGEIEHSELNSWTDVRHDDYDWSKCPIGHLPWH